MGDTRERTPTLLVNVTRTPSTGSINTESEWDPNEEGSSIEASAQVADSSSESSEDNDLSSASEEADESAEVVASGKQARQYNFNKRKKRKAPKKSRQKRWLEALDCTTVTKLRQTTCCKSRSCFRKVDYDFFLDQARAILSADRDTRRTVLRSLLTSNHRFQFNGKLVCGRFLRKAFRFSAVRISEVANGRITRPVRTATSAASVVSSALSANISNSSQQSSSPSPSTSTLQTKKEAIISFLERTADDCGDSMPNKPEIHLPFYQIQELYPIFLNEFKLLHPTITPPTRTYFRRTWQTYCPTVKVMKSTRFTVCTTCDQIRTKLREKIISGESTESLRMQRKAHLNFVFAERREYAKKRDRAKLHSSEACSVIIDGADESAFGIPHFTTTPKSQRGHGMKVKLIGLLEHQLEPRLSLYTMTEEHKTGANHIIETIHRFLVRKRAEGPLPAKFYIQMDNCSRENKNKYLMGYLEMLVATSVFSCVEAGFLPVGHTHEDIDQVFSRTASKLRVTNAITLDDMHQVLRSTYNQKAHVERLKRLVNWSGLCDDQRCLNKIDKITQWRYFMFTRDSKQNEDSHVNGDGPRTFRTVCHVKRNCIDEWTEMFRNHGHCEQRGVLKTLPDLSRTPALRVECPAGVEKVSKRFWSEESRVGDVDKMVDLHELRDFVFQDRVDEFHWDLNESPETEYYAIMPEAFRLSQKDSQIVQDSGSSDSDSEREGEEEDGIENSDDESNDSDQVAVERAHLEKSKKRNSTCIEDRRQEAGSSKAAESKRLRLTSEPTNKVDYQINSFVAVKTDVNRQTNGAKFWIAKVVEAWKERNASYVTKLRVHWYDCDKDDKKKNGILNAKYDPCYDEPERKTRKPSRSKASRQQLQRPKYDIIHTDSVLVSFDSLTKKRQLPVEVQKKIEN